VQVVRMVIRSEFTERSAKIAWGWFSVTPG